MRILSMFVLVVCAGCAATLEGTVASAAEDLGPPPKRTDKAKAINHYLASLMYERRGDFERALAELEKASLLEPNSESLRMKLLGAYYLSEDFENAAKAAERAVEDDPDNVLLRIWLGRIYFQMDKVEEAVDAFQEAIELDPDNLLGYEALAEVEETTHDVIGALDVYKKLLEIAPDSFFLHYRRGYLFALTGNEEEAIPELKEALELNPDLIDAIYLLGILHLDLEKFTQAEEYLRDYVEKAPANTLARTQFAAAIARQGRWNEALAEYEELIESEQGNSRHHLDRMYLMLRRGEIEDPSVAVAPSGAPIVGTVLEALVRRAAGEPYEPLLRTVDTLEGDLEYESSGLLNGLMGLFGADDAGAYLTGEFKTLLEETGSSEVIETLYGRALMAQDKFAEAVEVLERTNAQHGPDKWLHYYLATAYEELENPTATERHLKASLALDPTDADVMNFLGYFYAEQNRELDEAQRLIEEALKSDPGNGFYLDSLGWVYYRKGDADKAIDHIHQAIRSDDMQYDDAVLRDHLGDAYLMKGNVDEAVAQWRRALRLDPELAGVKGKIERYGTRAGG